MNKLLVTLLLAWVGLTNAAAAAGRELPAQEQFLATFVRAARQQMEALEARNRRNDQRGESHLNQYLVYIDCRTLAGADPWVGSVSRLLSDNDARFSPIHADIINRFDRVHNVNGAKKARFYILFVDNYPIHVPGNTNITSYTALKNSQPHQVEETEAAAKAALQRALEQVHQRAGDLRSYQHWVALTLGTVVTVRNVNGTDRTIEAGIRGFSHFNYGGANQEKASCYLLTRLSWSNVSSNPLERVRIRAANMVDYLSEIVNNTTAYQGFVCGQGSGTGNAGGGNLIVNNYSDMKLSDEQALALILQGKRQISDGYGRQRHTALVKLFLTDQNTRTKNAALYDKADRYVPGGDTIKLWLHHDGANWAIRSGLPNSVQSLASVYERHGYTLSVNGLLAQLQSSVGGTDVDKICTGLYEFFDWVGRGVEKLRIPEYVWNSQHSDYKPVYATVYAYATLPMQPMRDAVQLGINRMVQDDLVLAAKLDKVTPAEVEFAALCGVWNGAVDILGAVPKLLGFMSKFGSESGLEKLKQEYEHLSAYQREESGQVVSTGIWGALKDGVKDSFDPTQPCKFAHNTSGIILGIAITIVQPEFVEAVLGKIGVTFFNILKVLDAAGEKLNPFSHLAHYTGKFVGRAGSAAYTVVRRGTKDIVYKLDNGFFIARLYAQSVQDARWVSMPEAQLAGVTDHNGVFHMNASNQYDGYRILPSVEDVLDEALQIGQSLRDELVRKGISLSRLQALLGQVPDAKRPALANALNQVTVSDLGKFADELSGNKPFLDYFSAQGAMGARPVGDAWEAITRPQMRQDPAILASVSKLLANNGDFLAGIKPQFDRILENLGAAGARCRTCPNPGTNQGLRHVDEILADLDYAITKFKNTDGFDKLLTEMAAGKEKADGGAFLLQVLQARGDNFSSQIQGFEKFYLSGAKFEADIQLTSGKLLEFKSWGKETWYNLNAGSSFEQLKAYFRSGNEFEYVGNQAKLVEAGVSDPQQFVRERFRAALEQENYGIFQIIWDNQTLVKRFGLSGLNAEDARIRFIRQVNTLDEKLFAFIKTE